MQYQTEILRFKEGARSHHPSPEATIAAAQPHAMSDAGDHLAVLVDLMPQLPYRSREIRSLVAKTYWNASGSIVARLRRALVAANRHLVSFNRKAVSGNKCAGNITCAVFSGDELFLGQVGAAYAYVRHPPTIEPASSDGLLFEIFPKRDRLLIPLGGTVLPAINIGYTMMQPGTVACLATTRVAEALARETWQQLLALSRLDLIGEEISQALVARKISGSVVLFRAHPSSKPATLSGIQSRRSQERHPSKRQPPAGEIAASLTPIPQPHEIAAPQPAAPAVPAATTSAQPVDIAPSRPQSVSSVLSSDEGVSPVETSGVDRRRATIPESESEREIPRPHISPPPVGDWIRAIKARFQDWREMRKKNTVDRTTTAERARLRQALRTLMPVQVEDRSTSKPKTPPLERGSLMSGLALGFLIVVALISITMYSQYGGPLKAEELLKSAHTLREQAYLSQDPGDWQQLLETAEQIARLAPQDSEAQDLLREAQQAVNTLESAAVLNIIPLLDLGTAPRPRRLVAAEGWIYILNTATDGVMALPLNADHVSVSAETPTTILRRGQTHLGAVVGHLVDLAWVDSGGPYSDGAVFIYSEDGALFIYEPALGPGNITAQYLQGDLAPGNVTLMETFGDRCYLVNRQINQIQVYESINGLYERPRLYFSEGVAPDLQLALDVAIDGRIYLLMGDGTIRTFFAGAQDHSFGLNGLPDDEFKPLVIALGDPMPENPEEAADSAQQADVVYDEGLVYLVEMQQERIIVLDKQGTFLRQYKLPKGELKRIEALSVDREAGALYLIAENQLFAAPLPHLETNAAP